MLLNHEREVLYYYFLKIGTLHSPYIKPVIQISGTSLGMRC